MQAIAAMAIPLCVSTVVIVLNETLQYRVRIGDLVMVGVWMAVMGIGPIAGFAMIVGAFRGRRLMLAGLATLYSPFWWSFNLLYWLFLSQKVVYHYCTDPRPGACWP